MLEKLKHEYDILYWKRKFVKANLKEKIVIRGQKKASVHKTLEKLKFPRLPLHIGDEITYKYTEIPLYSLTKEKVDELKKQYEEKKREVEILKKTSIQKIWLSELDELEIVYKKWIKKYVV